MRPERNDRPAKKLYIDGIFASNRVAAIDKVCTELGIPFERVKASGEQYPIGNGSKTATVPQNMEFVIIRSGDRDLGDLWRKVDAIAPMPTPNTSTK